MIQIKDKPFEILLSNPEIEANINQLAEKLNIEFFGKKPLFLAVLNGSFMFAAALFKKLTIEAEISFLRVQSYENTVSKGSVKQILGLTESIENRAIIILEDIIDTGLTIKEVVSYLGQQNPESIHIATLLFKPKALKTDIKPDYYCFEIEPHFVIGYGLDYDGLGRNLSDIYVLKN